VSPDKSPALDITADLCGLAETRTGNGRSLDGQRSTFPRTRVQIRGALLGRWPAVLLFTNSRRQLRELIHVLLEVS